MGRCVSATPECAVEVCLDLELALHDADELEPGLEGILLGIEDFEIAGAAGAEEVCGGADGTNEDLNLLALQSLEVL